MDSCTVVQAVFQLVAPRDTCSTPPRVSALPTIPGGTAKQPSAAVTESSLSTPTETRPTPSPWKAKARNSYKLLHPRPISPVTGTLGRGEPRAPLVSFRFPIRRLGLT